MTHSLLKKEAKACLENLPGKILLYLLPLLLTLFQFGLQVHQRYLLEMGAAIATAPSLFPLLLRIISAFLFLSASFALLAALRGQKDKLTVNDGTLSLTRPYFWKSTFLLLFRYLLNTLWSLTFFIGVVILTVGTTLAFGALNKGNPLTGPLLLSGLGLSVTIIGAIIALNRKIAYSMAGPIMYDQIRLNTYIGSVECLNDSVALMKGHKWQYFKLVCSFIGWFILVIFSLGILAFYVIPYYKTTSLCFYEKLRKAHEAELADTSLTE